MTLERSKKEERISSLPRKVLIFIFATALVVRIALMVMLRSWEFPDEWTFGYEMGLLGERLASGKGFVLRDVNSPTAAFPPVYPLVVGGVFSIFGIYSKAAAIVLLLLQIVCSAVAAVCLAVLGNRLLDRNTGLVAGLLWAFYPSSIHFSVNRIWYTELAVMLLLLAMAIAVRAEHPPTLRRVLLLGGLSGLIVLTDSTMALYLPLLVLWMLLSRGVKLSRLIVLAVAWGVIAGVVVSPWAIRNWLVLGSPRIVKSNFGAALFYGNNPFSSGVPTRAALDQAFAALDQEELSNFSYDPSTHQGRPELAYNRYLRNKAIEWIQTHPFGFLHLTGKRIWYFWGMISTKTLSSWLRFALFTPFAILAVWGLLHDIRRRWDLAPAWLFLLVYPLPYYVIHMAVYRYRYPVEPLIVLLAAIPLAIWIEPALCRILSRQGLFHLHSPSGAALRTSVRNVHLPK